MRALVDRLIRHRKALAVRPVRGLRQVPERAEQRRADHREEHDREDREREHHEGFEWVHHLRITSNSVRGPSQSRRGNPSRAPRVGAR